MEPFKQSCCNYNICPLFTEGCASKFKRKSTTFGTLEAADDSFSVYVSVVNYNLGISIECRIYIYF